MKKTLASVLHSCVIVQTRHADFDDLKSVGKYVAFFNVRLGHAARYLAL